MAVFLVEVAWLGVPIVEFTMAVSAEQTGDLIYLAFYTNMSVLRFITTLLMLKSKLWTLVTLQTTLPSFSKFTKFPCHMAYMINSPNADTIPQLIRNSKPKLKQKL